MSTTPRSSSPTKQDRSAFDQSMMVELPTHLGDGTELIEPPEEDVTVRLRAQSQSQSPTRKQRARPEQNQELARIRHLERQRQTRTPEPQKRRSNKSEIQSPGHLAAFNWDDFEERYEKALQEADEQEKQLLDDFDSLVKVCETTAWTNCNP